MKVGDGPAVREWKRWLEIINSDDFLEINANYWVIYLYNYSNLWEW